jgi:SET domain-containing protein
MSELHAPLDHYTFCWSGTRPHALALGIGSLLNHSAEPNAYFMRDTLHGLVRFYTLRPVVAGEELFISYGEHLWFTDADADAEQQQQSATASLVETTASFMQTFPTAEDLFSD